MAPSPEYDKEPKAPDKSSKHISSEDTKLLHNLVKEQHNSSDHKPTNSATNSEVENKHVETLDDEKLRALLDEAITYKCPKDREGKSSLFKELLEEVEQDEQACEAAARNLTGCRGSRRGARGRRALPHSNSLQDLVAALAAEPAPRHTRHHPRHHAPAPSNVSARAIHGGSLPSGVDTSSLLSEEGSGAGCGAGYLATVRCVNPPPLAERRVSASDANAPQELELLNRRSKPMFPMTYTARATLEIGSGSVSSGRAVTTTTASNQVRTQARYPLPPTAATPAAARAPRAPRARSLTRAVPERHYRRLYDPNRGGGALDQGKRPRGPIYNHDDPDTNATKYIPNEEWDRADSPMADSVDEWYRGLAAYDKRRRCDATWTAAADCARSLSAPMSPAHQDYARRRSIERCAMESPECELGSDADRYRVEGHSKFSDNYEGDISLRKSFRGNLGKGLVTPTVSMINPRNVKSMTIGKPLSYFNKLNSVVVAERAADNGERIDDKSKADLRVKSTDSRSDFKGNVRKNNEICIEIESDIAMSVEEDQTSKCFQMSAHLAGAARSARSARSADIELEEIATKGTAQSATSFTEYLAGQTKLIEAMEAADAAPAPLHDEYINIAETNNNVHRKYSEKDNAARDVSSEQDLTEIETIDLATEADDELVRADRRSEDRAGAGDRFILAELPNNAYIFLTLPKRLLNKDDKDLHEIESNNNVKPIANRKRRRKEKVPVGTSSSKRTDMINRNALRVLLFENFLKSDREMSGHGSTNKEVDSGIPFSCITTPEVVGNCNTTSSSSTAVAVDSKPLQLGSGSGYRAVSSLTGSPPTESTPPDARPSTSAQDAPDLQPRNGNGSSFNELPLSQPNYGSTDSTTDEKKTVDENGNAVQGSPVSGSSLKKFRKKRTTKNETVIDCQLLAGYRGTADVNELLRFIESNPDTRGPKMRAKHKDDADDKASKKRSSDRRKDKEKVKRASSLEELSRTKLEDLTARVAPAPKPERRSWGDATPSAPELDPEPALTPEPEPDRNQPASPPETEQEIDDPIEPIAFELPMVPIVEQADFQTVRKKRKPRRRTEEAASRARQPSPRRQESAPASDRSNDSNDDMDSVHSIPQPGAAAAPPLPHASYADIARTRHNIPDLIESCNYYTEADAPAPIETDYPALETRLPEPAIRRESKPAGPRRDRKPPPCAADDGPAPAPDVVSDRRPPVILLDSNSRPRDMDGVTFGFDINEQLLVAGGRGRGRCDLVRDAVPGPGPGTTPGPGPGTQGPRGARRPLRYLPPAPPHNAHHLHQIIDYVATAWEDVIRCGGGKVPYFSE